MDALTFLVIVEGDKLGLWDIVVSVLAAQA
jgi:hypothetical protein